jgi:hypothetical protein
MSYAYLFKYIIIGDTGESMISIWNILRTCRMKVGCILVDILWAEIVSHFSTFVCTNKLRIM